MAHPVFLMHTQSLLSVYAPVVQYHFSSISYWMPNVVNITNVWNISEVGNDNSILRADFIQDLLPSAERTALLYHLTFLSLGEFPKLERVIRDQAIETQLLFGSSEALLQKVWGVIHRNHQCQLSALWFPALTLQLWGWTVDYVDAVINFQKVLSVTVFNHFWAWLYGRPS